MWKTFSCFLFFLSVHYVLVGQTDTQSLPDNVDRLILHSQFDEALSLLAERLGRDVGEDDVAGAVAEFDLDQYEADELVRQIEEHGVRVDAELLTFCRVAYLAFRLGQARLGATMVSDPREHARVERRADAYAAQLQHLLEGSRAATRPDSLVG